MFDSVSEGRKPAAPFVETAVSDREDKRKGDFGKAPHRSGEKPQKPSDPNRPSFWQSLVFPQSSNRLHHRTCRRKGYGGMGVTE